MQRITFITGLLLAALASTHAALEVIGSGYGRTGTDTLRMALNELGYKTYHMHEIIENGLLSDVHAWTALAENDCNDVQALKDLFERGGWTAAVDFPASICWKTLMKVYPHAKVVHTERESEEKWWDSVSNSIAILPKTFPINIIMKVVPFWKAHAKMMNAIWSYIGGVNITMSDPEWPSSYQRQLVSAYSANNKRVRQVVPRKRLLVQDHRRGWELLAPFLGKDIPDKPYPHRNTRAELIQTARRLTLGVSFSGVVFLVMAVFVVKKLMQVFVKSDNKKKE
ncbi:hypothetical protein HJC23_003780 [Cyclotella cryptica]|uniref:Uncharacterized protein n=1 Tax=Cyclotella cryptica TaxID=29204 RepID=A0ABD3QX86_9STRA|eukprot:CCRYP_002234-RA/>CCRYP_002234-RA protein AED:0.13 eAED:0.13 QI:0/-1/0/1/-1/1/1/0/281